MSPLVYLLLLGSMEVQSFVGPGPGFDSQFGAFLCGLHGFQSNDMHPSVADWTLMGLLTPHSFSTTLLKSIRFCYQGIVFHYN